MPTYEYKCDACGHQFERFQSIMADPVRRCPECGKAKVRRLISSGAGLIFKGSGFYITDYRDKSYADKAKAESGSGTSNADGKADTKSESKSDSTPGETKAQAKSADAKSADAKPKSESKPAAEKSES